MSNRNVWMTSRTRRRHARNETVRMAGQIFLGSQQNKPGTGNPLHTQEPVTVASFRTWRGWREDVA